MITKGGGGRGGEGSSDRRTHQFVGLGMLDLPLPPPPPCFKKSDNADFFLPPSFGDEGQALYCRRRRRPWLRLRC